MGSLNGGNLIMRIAYVVSSLSTFVVNEMIGVQAAGHELGNCAALLVPNLISTAWDI